jgi:hypothetical protein
MRRIALGILFASLASAAMAQVMAPQSSGSSNNSNMALIAPTAPVGTNNNQIATTAWVGNFLNGLTAFITNAMLANMNPHTHKGNNTGMAGPPIDLTQAQLTAELNPCTSSLQGLVPAPPNNTTTFLRGDCTFAVPSLTIATATNSLGADVLLNNTANYFDGPSVAQGTSGTWFASGTVTLIDTGVAANINCKLWDGTTVIASTNITTPAANFVVSESLSGYLASPAANLKISCKDAQATTGKILFNGTANSKDSTITAFRIQ